MCSVGGAVPHRGGQHGERRTAMYPCVLRTNGFLGQKAGKAHGLVRHALHPLCQVQRCCALGLAACIRDASNATVPEKDEQAATPLCGLRWRSR